MYHIAMDYLQLSLNFMEESKRARNLTELATTFYNAIKKLGCTHFICLSHVNVFSPPEDAVILSNYPMEWGLHHHAQGYHKSDPIMETCKSQITPFTWSNERWRATLDLNKANILNEASEFQLSEGHTIPIHTGDGYPASCSVVFQQGEVAPEALAVIHMMSIYLYETAIKMKVRENKKMKKDLSLRQKQCLEYIAQGKSDWAISKLLSISEHTVQYHVKEILRRYKVSSRNQAIIRGLFYGDITYMDILPQSSLPTKDSTSLVHLTT